ncbi:MAG: hypothetical protein IT318_24710 [Anaerolineales bacterium]|nr:hypothetical protein [Anaerolineales bacterium]
MSDGIGNALIKAERRRQLQVERWTAEHDDEHEDGALEQAAHCYWTAQNAQAEPPGAAPGWPSEWPWDIAWWKPRDRLSNLIRAGALYLAGADRALRHNLLDLQAGDLAHVVTIGDEIDELVRGRSIAHRSGMNPLGWEKYPDGVMDWHAAEPPNLTGDRHERRAGMLRACPYCGSMHPADLVAAIRAGAVGSWADRKYGWPHKAYFDRIPNPHVGMLESRAAANYEVPGYRKVQDGFDPHTGEPTYHWREEGRPAAALTQGKFYSVHLQDALTEERALIEQHLGIVFHFGPDGRSVAWQRWEPPAPLPQDDGSA